jgi:putative hydrolase of the HAD superfamily
LDDQVFSADAGAWKPHRDIFEMELTALALKPEEAIFVGDSLYFDVWGAQQAGLRGVWIEQKVRWLPDGLEVTPDAIIQNLPELLDVIETWR